MFKLTDRCTKITFLYKQKKVFTGLWVVHQLPLEVDKSSQQPREAKKSKILHKAPFFKNLK